MRGVMKYWCVSETMQVRFRCTYSWRISRPILNIFQLNMPNIQPPRLQQSRIRRSSPPPHRIRMRPNGLTLTGKESTRIKLVRMKGARIVILNTRPRHWMVVANRYLRQDVICLDRHEDVARWVVGAGGSGGCSIAKGGEDVSAAFEPCAGASPRPGGFPRPGGAVRPGGGGGRVGCDGVTLLGWSVSHRGAVVFLCGGTESLHTRRLILKPQEQIIQQYVHGNKNEKIQRR